MEIIRGIKGQIYPTDQQAQHINQSCGNVRFVWNQLLDMLNTRYENNPTLPMLRRFGLQKLLPLLKKEYSFLKTTDSTAYQQVTKKLSEAFSQFFDGKRGYPNFKRKQYEESYHSTNNQESVAQVSKHWIKLPKLGLVKYYGNKVTGEVLSATIRRSNTGEFFVSFTVKCESQTLDKTDKAIGIDLGLTDFVVTSDGQKVKLPKYHNRLKEKRVKWERLTARRRDLAKERLGRDFSEAKNYQKSRRMVAKLRRKEVNQRQDFLHKLSLHLVKEYDVIVLEDLSIKGMMKNRNLAEAIGHQSWREFRDMLAYKCDWYGKTFISVDPRFTSQTCSDCGVNTGPKALHIREFMCPHCGALHDRDVNAANNILQKGLAVSITA